MFSPHKSSQLARPSTAGLRVWPPPEWSNWESCTQWLPQDGTHAAPYTRVYVSASHRGWAASMGPRPLCHLKVAKALWAERPGVSRHPVRLVALTHSPTAHRFHRPLRWLQHDHSLLTYTVPVVVPITDQTSSHLCEPCAPRPSHVAELRLRLFHNDAAQHHQPGCLPAPPAPLPHIHSTASMATKGSGSRSTVSIIPNRRLLISRCAIPAASCGPETPSGPEATPCAHPFYSSRTRGCLCGDTSCQGGPQGC